ncbi:MAG: M12 family metallo-peptidase, partial [Anaerolineae bacterium]|nr:M12 family metallo-peptidase [Anaerolineae bacterium]
MKRILLGIALVAVLLLSATSSGLAYQGSGGDLFEEAGRTVGILGVSQQTVIRSRNVNVHFNLLPDAADVAGDQAAGSDLILNLFADVSYTAVFDEMTSISPTSYSWAGHLEGVKLSNVNLVVDDGNMVGNIVFPGGMYSIRYQANGTHTIYELDPAAFPPEEPSQSGRRDGSPGMAAVDDDAYQSLAVGNVEDGSVIDVLVVYTGDAETAAGGSAAINTLINLAIAETNTGYAQSDIFTRMRLVHTQKVTYSEAAFNWFTTVNRLRNNGDGYMDNVHTLRNKYRADVVMLLVANGAYCGLAYDIMNPVSHAFNANAFAITNYSCATGYYSFGHEAGHLQSARHDWYVDDTLNSPYSFNHALVHPSVTPANHWRTVMGYANDCIDSGFGNCTRLLYWSNPFNVYSGDVMGFEQGTNTSCTYLNLANPDCDADNHRTLNQTAVTMANFRIAELEPLAPKGTIKDRTPTYKWTKKKNATQYQLQVTQNYVQIINVKMGSGVCIGVRCSFTPA